MQAAWILPAAAVAIAWLWFLARGWTRGGTKRLALRATLVAVVGVLVAMAAERGLFLHASLGFRAAFLLALLTVVVGYLYLVRFCVSCGRMVRNLKDPTCPRCDAWLPLHGLTTRLRRPGDDRGWNPREKRQRPPRHPEGPRA